MAITNNMVTWGYDQIVWARYGIKLPYRFSLNTLPHTLLTGGSGSGKSTALLFTLKDVVKSGVKLTFCDFKASDDFAFLRGYEHFYSGDACYEGIMSYYEDLVEARKAGSTRDKRVRLLIVDEYAAMISYFTTLDKNNKTKHTGELLNAIAEILMLGRNINGITFAVWLTAQRPDSSLFGGSSVAGGGRDNFMVICALGKLSREHRQMIGAETDTDRVYSAGEGILIADGRETTHVKFPLISNMNDWKRHIIRALGATGGT